MNLSEQYFGNNTIQAAMFDTDILDILSHENGTTSISYLISCLRDGFLQESKRKWKRLPRKDRLEDLIKERGFSVNYEYKNNCIVRTNISI